eukprot:m.54185 g.54185  ORF g.54185 m.54185 type:complete len:66 (-) comp11876_c0_seq3:192-389(-)
MPLDSGDPAIALVFEIEESLQHGPQSKYGARARRVLARLREMVRPCEKLLSGAVSVKEVVGTLAS